MNESIATTMIDEYTSSTETPILVTDKSKDVIIEGSVSTSTVPSINGEILNTPPIIKQKLPKLAIIAGKPWR